MSATEARIHVSPEEKDDLRSRLRKTRWATPWPLPEWEAGVSPDELRRLVDHWVTDYDWTRHENDINRLPSYYADVDGTPVHYLYFAGEGPDPLPLVLTNGWPSSFLELVPLARRLSRPSDHGRESTTTFTVVVPSLPGFTLSPQRPTLGAHLPTHEIWHRLMTDELGFRRYAAHGGDLGAGVTARLAQAHPESLTGIHVLSVANPNDVDPTSLTEAERLHLDTLASWTTEEGGYLHQQSTRPLTLAPALSDSPTGLLAWLLEKHYVWSDRGSSGKLPFSDDHLLTQASLYWFTNCISTSFRPYFEHHHEYTAPVTYVSTPTAVAVFPADLSRPPRRWAERTYNVVRYTVMPRGGHFAALEEPELLAADISAFLADLR